MTNSDDFIFEKYSFYWASSSSNTVGGNITLVYSSFYRASTSSSNTVGGNII
jgi:hypothetical protein